MANDNLDPIVLPNNFLRNSYGRVGKGHVELSHTANYGCLGKVVLKVFR